MGLIPEFLTPAKLRRRWHWRRSRSRNARLTIVSQYFPPDFAATGQFVEDLSQRLAERGLQNLVLTGQPGYAFHTDLAERIEFRPNRCIRRTALTRFWPHRIRGRLVNSLLFCLRTLTRLLRQGRRGDLLLFTSEPAYLPVVGWLCHLLTRAPFVVLIYDLYPDIAVSLKVVDGGHPLVRLWRYLQAATLEAASEVIVLSTTMRDRIRQAYPDVETPISVIPSWADPARIRPQAKADNWFVQRHNLQPVFTVLYSGNQGRCHDLDTLLEAAAHLRENASIRFLIVGAGVQHGHLRHKAGRLGLRHVQFLPYQDADAVPAMLAAADLAVVSLRHEAEGQVAPSKLYGHLAAATPVAVICGPHSYLRREIEQAGCGASFRSGASQPLAEYIRGLAADPQRCRQLGEAGRRHLLATATPGLAVQAYAEVLARHLPLDQKRYARALSRDARPLPNGKAVPIPNPAPARTVGDHEG